MSLRLGFLDGGHVAGGAHLRVGFSAGSQFQEGGSMPQSYVQDLSPWKGRPGALNVPSASVLVTYCPQAISTGMFAR